MENIRETDCGCSVGHQRKQRALGKEEKGQDKKIHRPGCTCSLKTIL